MAKSVEELEALIKQKTEVDNKEALNALRKKQRDELKELRKELHKQKQQEKEKLTKEVGDFVINKLLPKNENGDSDFEYYHNWLKSLVSFWNDGHKK